MVITFIDAGVLIAAARGRTEVSAQAMAVLDDPDRTFASSEFVRLEVLPKALFNRNVDEAERLRGLRETQHARRPACGRFAVQDEATSAVWGMPGAAARTGLVDQVLPQDEIAAYIARVAETGV